jgi:hypothetical protein
MDILNAVPDHDQRRYCTGEVNRDANCTRTDTRAMFVGTKLDVYAHLGQPTHALLAAHRTRIAAHQGELALLKEVSAVQLVRVLAPRDRALVLHGLPAKDVGFSVGGSGFRVLGLGSWVQGLGSRV